MKRLVLAVFIIGFVTEMLTSLWIWQSQPSHGLVDYYQYSFWNYATERMVPWFVIVVILIGGWLFVGTRSFMSKSS